MKHNASIALEGFCRGALNEPGMSSGMIATIVTASIVCYLGMIGVTARGFYRWEKFDDWEHPAPAFWPALLLFVPIWMGSRVVAFITRPRVPEARVVERP